MSRAGRPPLQGAQLGSVVGVVGGLVFVLVNAGPLPASPAWRGLAVASAAAVVALLVVRPAPAPVEPSTGALRVYLVSVGAMVLAIPVGAAVLNGLDRPGLVLPWVVLVVGLHFVPFARAFAAPVFSVLGAVLVLVAVVGAGAALAGADHAGAATGVAAGLALLAAAAAPYVRRA